MLHLFLASWMVAPTTPTPVKEVRCSIVGDPVFAPHSPHIDGTPLAYHYTADQIVLTGVGASGEAKVRLGDTPVEKDISWQNGRCNTITLPAAVVYGTIDNRTDAPIALQACGELRWIEANAEDYVFPLDRMGCTVTAARQDGRLIVYADPPAEFEETRFDNRFDIDLPDAMQGGMGITFRPTWQGMMIRSVLPGSPADQAGLRPGELIVALDGTSVIGWTMVGFLRHAVGPVGSLMRLGVVGPDGQRDVTLSRRVID